MNIRATVGDNNPPSPIDPIEAVLAEYDGTITEAQNWTDGEPVADVAGMEAVDDVLKEFKTYKTALTAAAKERTAPLHTAWKAEVATVKIYTDDAALLQNSLIAIVAPFKEKLAATKRAEERAAWEVVEKARRDAEAKAAAANAANADDMREVAVAKAASIEAEKQAKRANSEQPKGMRTVHHYSLDDDRAALHWIAANNKPAMAGFIADYVAKNFKACPIDGVKTWTTKEAF